ncbi:hypothetical protein HPP92_017075 [Vanilla planifolia]|uniref:Uncharacterized protein n=1 Tax=Vanilla planifolia TaxID=51239 RepID=A0A835QEQ2_VANPL|nr:hypothetical protein HPP92_017075 [Vanilla planifolia]
MFLKKFITSNCQKPKPYEQQSRPPTAAELLRAYCSSRGHVSSSGLPDETQAARQILKDYVDGKIPHFELPSKTTTTSTDAKENNLMAMEEQNTSTDESDACESEGQDSASIGPRETKLEHVLDDLESFELASAAVSKKTGAASKTKPQASKGMIDSIMHQYPRGLGASRHNIRISRGRDSIKRLQLGSPVVGPRPAPTYSVVNAIIEVKEDGPGSRCGHTLTAVAAVGRKGRQGLAGATADVHCYDVLGIDGRGLLHWENHPHQGLHMLQQLWAPWWGGIGPAGLSTEDLHVLDLTQQRPRWHRVVVQGPGPGPRYGHVMALVGQRFLLCIGGNDGRKRPLADVWALDTAAKPYEWRKLEPEERERERGCLGEFSTNFDQASLSQVSVGNVSFVVIQRVYVRGFNLFFWLLDQGIFLCSRILWQVHMDLLSIEMDVGNGLLLQVSLLLQDTNTQLFLSTQGFMYLVGLLGVGEWWKIPRALQLLLRQQFEASHAAAVAAAATYNQVDHPEMPHAQMKRKDRLSLHSVPDGSVNLGTPVAPPVNGDLYSDISTENAMLQGPRYTAKVVVAAETGGALGGMVRQLSIDQFENEGRRVSYGTPENATAARKLLDRQMSINSVPKKVIAHLLKPRGWKPPVRRQFFLDCNEIADLCDNAERIFSIRGPHRLFDEYGAFNCRRYSELNANRPPTPTRGVRK